MSEDIFKIDKDIIRAKELFNLAKERQDIIKILPRDKSYKIVEEYYEIILELLTTIMYLDGYKTLSHVKVLEYFSSNYKDLNDIQLQLIDTIRKSRNGIVYYGKKVNELFLINNEKDIKIIISLLIKLIENKLKKSKNE